MFLFFYISLELCHEKKNICLSPFTKLQSCFFFFRKGRGFVTRWMTTKPEASRYLNMVDMMDS